MASVYGSKAVGPWGPTVCPEKVDISFNVILATKIISIITIIDQHANRQVYSGTTDPYLSFLSDSHSLFSTKPTSNGKKSDPLKFSDPLSFGTSDPLRFDLQQSFFHSKI